MNKNPGTRIICEWCHEIIIGRRKRFCSKLCQNRFLSNNQSDETRRKNSEANKGENNYWYGKHHSDETKQKLRNANLGKEVSDDTRMKLSESLSGREFSEDHKRHLSESLKGHTAGMTGHTHSDDTKDLMRSRQLEVNQDYQYDPDAPQSEYRRKAIEAYGYECSGCGCTEGKLVVHHLDGDHSNDELSNLVVLCQGCHNRIHPRKFQGDSSIDEEFTRMVVESRDSKCN